MSNSDGKLSVGEIWRPPPTDIWNAMIRAGLRELRQGSIPISSQSATPHDYDRIKVKNISGADCPGGKALEIGAPLIKTMIDGNTTVTHSRYGDLIYEADVPNTDTFVAAGSHNQWGIAPQVIPAGEIGDLIISGYAVAKVTVNDASVGGKHTCVDVVDGSIVTGTGYHGARIVSRPSSTTGERDMLINLSDRHYGPYLLESTSEATSSPYFPCGATQSMQMYDEAGAATGDYVDVYFPQIGHAQTISESGYFVFAHWFPRWKRYAIISSANNY